MRVKLSVKRPLPWYSKKGNYKRPKIDLEAKELERISPQNDKKDTTSTEQNPTCSSKPCQSSQQVHQEPVYSVDPDHDERKTLGRSTETNVDNQRTCPQISQNKTFKKSVINEIDKLWSKIHESPLDQKPRQYEPFDRKSTEVNPIGQKTNPEDVAQNTPSNPQKSTKLVNHSSDLTEQSRDEQQPPAQGSILPEVNVGESTGLKFRDRNSPVVHCTMPSSLLTMSLSVLNSQLYKQSNVHTIDENKQELLVYGHIDLRNNQVIVTKTNEMRSPDQSAPHHRVTSKKRIPVQELLSIPKQPSQSNNQSYRKQQSPAQENNLLQDTYPIEIRSLEQNANFRHIMDYIPIPVQKLSSIANQSCQLNDQSYRKQQSPAHKHNVPQVMYPIEMRRLEQNAPHRFTPNNPIPGQKLSSVAQQPSQVNDQSNRKQQSPAHEHSSPHYMLPIGMRRLEQNAPHYRMKPNEPIPGYKLSSVAKQPSQEHISPQAMYPIEIKRVEQNAPHHQMTPKKPISGQKLSSVAKKPSQVNDQSYRKQQSPAHEHILPQRTYLDRNALNVAQNSLNVANQSYQASERPPEEQISPTFRGNFPQDSRVPKMVVRHTTGGNPLNLLNYRSNTQNTPYTGQDYLNNITGAQMHNTQYHINQDSHTQRTFVGGSVAVDSIYQRTPQRTYLDRKAPNVSQNSSNVANQSYQTSERPQEEQVPPAFRENFSRDPRIRKMFVRRTTGGNPLNLLNYRSNTQNTPYTEQDYLNNITGAQMHNTQYHINQDSHTQRTFVGSSVAADRIDQRTHRLYPVQNSSNFANIEAFNCQDPYTEPMFLEKSTKATPSTNDQRACIQGTENNIPFARQNIATAANQSTQYSERLKQYEPVYGNYPLQDSYIQGVLERPFNMNNMNQGPISQIIPHNTSSAVQHTVNSANHSCRSCNSSNGKQCSSVAQKYSYQDPRMHDFNRPSVYPESHINNRPSDSIEEQFSPMSVECSLPQSCKQEISDKRCNDQNFIRQNVCPEKNTENKTSAEQNGENITEISPLAEQHLPNYENSLDQEMSTEEITIKRINGSMIEQSICSESNIGNISMPIQYSPTAVNNFSNDKEVTEQKGTIKSNNKLNKRKKKDEEKKPSYDEDDNIKKSNNDNENNYKAIASTSKSDTKTISMNKPNKIKRNYDEDTDENECKIIASTTKNTIKSRNQLNKKIEVKKPTHDEDNNDKDSDDDNENNYEALASTLKSYTKTNNKPNKIKRKYDDNDDENKCKKKLNKIKEEKKPNYDETNDDNGEHEYVTITSTSIGSTKLRISRIKKESNFDKDNYDNDDNDDKNENEAIASLSGSTTKFKIQKNKKEDKKPNYKADSHEKFCKVQSLTSKNTTKSKDDFNKKEEEKKPNYDENNDDNDAENEYEAIESTSIGGTKLKTSRIKNKSNFNKDNYDNDDKNENTAIAPLSGSTTKYINQNKKEEKKPNYKADNHEKFYKLIAFTSKSTTKSKDKRNKKEENKSNYKADNHENFYKLIALSSKSTTKSKDKLNKKEEKKPNYDENNYDNYGDNEYEAIASTSISGTKDKPNKKETEKKPNHVQDNDDNNNENENKAIASSSKCTTKSKDKLNKNEAEKKPSNDKNNDDENEYKAFASTSKNITKTKDKPNKKETDKRPNYVKNDDDNNNKNKAVASSSKCTTKSKNKLNKNEAEKKPSNDKNNDDNDDENEYKAIPSTSKDITNAKDKLNIKNEKKHNYDVDNDDIDDDSGYADAKKKPDHISSLVLPPEYKPNNTKWTLKHQTSGPGIVEVLPGSSVYIDAKRLNLCKKTAFDSTSLARMLVTEIFTQNALSVCSLTGKRAIDIDHHDTDVRPSLDEHALQILLIYVEVYGNFQGWSCDVQAAMQIIESKIQIFRSLCGKV